MGIKATGVQCFFFVKNVIKFNLMKTYSTSYKPVFIEFKNIIKLEIC